MRCSTVFDRIFWLGDLNYRINGSREIVENLIGRPFGAHGLLLENDQLILERSRGSVFHRYAEAPLNFYPTYKFDKGTSTYDTSKKRRVPSWTDRILYRSADPNAILPWHTTPAMLSARQTIFL